jgi:hypothetical protein
MSTFRPNGSLRDNHDTQLWKEMLGKERFSTQLHQEYMTTDHFASTHASRFGKGKLSMPNATRNIVKDILNNDLRKT